MARATPAIRTHHAASPAHPHLGVGTGDRGRPGSSRCGPAPARPRAGFPTGGAVLVLERRVQAARADPRTRGRGADPGSGPRPCPSTAGHDVNGGSHHQRDEGRPRDRICAPARRSAGAGRAPPRARTVDRERIGRRQHRLRRRRHVRLRADAPRRRGRSQRSVAVARGVRDVHPPGDRRSGDTGVRLLLRPVGGRAGRSAADPPLGGDGRVHGAADGRSGRWARLGHAPERRGRSTGDGAVRARRCAGRPPGRPLARGDRAREPGARARGSGVRRDLPRRRP